jgi:hypothetical protein
MFKRGGGVSAKDSGIVQGFAPGGNVQSPDYADILSGYIQAPEEQKGMSSSDWLRIAAAGAEIMGAPGSGRDGWIGALQSASPALSGLGTDLAASKDSRRDNYLTRKSAYDAAMGNAAVQSASDQYTSDREREILTDTQTHAADMQDDQQEFLSGESDKAITHELDILEKTHLFENKKLDIEYKNAIKLLQEEARLNPYEFEKEYISGRGRELIAMMSSPDIAKTKYDELKNELVNAIYGDATRAAQDQKATLLTDSTFTDLLSEMTEGIEEEEAKNEMSAWYGMTKSQIFNKLKEQMFADLITEIYIPPYNPTQGVGKKDGGRVGLALGGNPDNYEERYREKEAEIIPEPGDENLDLTFAELRQRLPQEVSDSVIKLIINSEEAMIDFAKLQTAEDISIFNQKYNTDLELPQQVA